MPTPLIQSYAKKSGKPVWKVEEIWDRCKEQAKGIRRSSVIDRQYWALVNGLLKKELGLAEAISFKEFLTPVLEDTSVHLKDAQKVVNKFKKEHAASFRSKELEISAEDDGPGKVKISVKINRFLSDSSESHQEFEMLTQELVDCAEHHSAALTVNKEGFFGGPLAASLIKPGKTVNADALLSVVEVVLVYPRTSKTVK